MLDLGTSYLETVFIMVAGFLCGAVPAFILIGVYFGRRLERESSALKLSYERQLAALRATVRRMMERIEALTGERNQLQQANNELREVVREQHMLTDNAHEELEDAQQNIVRMQEQMAKMHEDNLRYQGRLEQADITQQRMAAQLQQSITQFTQAQRMRQNLIFAASQLRQAKAANQPAQANAGRNPGRVEEDSEVPPEKLDVGLIAGMQPEQAQRLHESGIHTIGDLARQTPARVAHFAGLQTWEDSAAWIAEARQRLAAGPS